MFQYNCCFGGIRPSDWIQTPSPKFQYNCCFGGIKRGGYKHRFNKIVSIQLLFRWNDDIIYIHQPYNMFQYNCCFGGMCLS